MEPNSGKPPGQQQQNGQRKPYDKKRNDPQKAQQHQKKKNAPEEQKDKDDIPKWNQQGMGIMNQNRIPTNPSENNFQRQQFFNQSGIPNIQQSNPYENNFQGQQFFNQGGIPNMQQVNPSTNFQGQQFFNQGGIPNMQQVNPYENNFQGLSSLNQNRIPNMEQVNPSETNFQGQQFMNRNNNNSKFQDGPQQQAQQQRNYPSKQSSNSNNKINNNNKYNNNNNNNNHNNNNNNNGQKWPANNRQNEKFLNSRNKNISSQETPSTPQEKDIRTGVFIVDEFGNQFVQEIINGGVQIKERLYLYPKLDSINRALHKSKVQFSLIIETNYKSNKPKNKAQILNVLDYQVEELVGQFGSRTEDKRPQIDFDIASKTFDYSAENEFYFYPLETKYPRMICKITDDEKGRYSNGELFKNYFKVKFLNWTEEMANEGPECEISEMMGRLYDKSADIDALLCTIHKTEHSFPKKEIDQIPLIKKEYQKKVTKQLKLFTDRTNLKVATIDSIGTFTFDDAISIQEISVESIQREVEKAIALNSEQDKDDQEQPEKKRKDKKESLTKQQQSKSKKLPKVKKNTKAAKVENVHQENTDNSDVESLTQDVPDEVIKNALDDQNVQREQKEDQSHELDFQQQFFFSAQEKFAAAPNFFQQDITQQNPQPKELGKYEKEKKNNKKKPEDADNKKPSKNAQKKNTRPLKNNKKVIEEEEKKYQASSEEEKKDEADSSDDDDENNGEVEEEKIEFENLESSSSSGIFRIGIHISELSETIKKGSELYKGTEKRGQSIYLRFGKRSKAVQHMLPIELLQLFSLTQNSTKLASTLFFCIAQSEANPDEFSILWETLRFELTKIKPAANYTYQQLDIAIQNQNKSRNNNLEQPKELVKNQEDSDEDQDSDSNDEEHQDFIAGQSNESNLKCMWSPRESNALIQFGQFLSRKREQQGQKIFQEDADESENRPLSSVTIEELMVLYNQEVSRKFQVKQHLIKGEKLLAKEVASVKEKLALLVKNIEKQMKALQKKEEPVKANLLKINKLMNAKLALRNSKKKQITNNTKLLLQKEKQLQLFAKQRELLSQQILKLQKKQEEEESMAEKEDLFDEQEWRNTFMQSQKERDEETQEERVAQEEEKSEIDENKDQDKRSENSDYSYQNQEESQSEQGDAIEVSDQLYNPFDFKLKSIGALILAKDKDISNIQIQLLAKEKELSSPATGANNFEREKRGFLKQVEYFERQCIDVGFKDLKYGDLDELRVSFEKLKRNSLIKEIVKKYLLFKKRAISRDLSNYFGIVEKEKKAKKEQQAQIKELTEKLKKAKTDQENLCDKQRKLQKQSEEYKTLHLGSEPKAQRDILLFEKEEEKAEEREEQQQQESDQQQELYMSYLENHQKIYVLDEENAGDSDTAQQYLNSSVSTQDDRERKQIQSKYQKSIKKLQKNIESLEQQSRTIEKFIAQNPANLILFTSQLEKIDTELATLKDVVSEIQKEAQTLKALKKELQDEIKKLEKQSQEEIDELKQSNKLSSEELFKHQEIIPESNVYVTATSPIRKFTDIVTQQMFIRYILSNAGNSEEFDKEYALLLNRKDKSTTNSNVLRQYQEKAKNLSKYRENIYRKLKKGMQTDKIEEILQIQSKYVPPRNLFDFFLPDETCQINFITSQKIVPIPNFQIWDGLIQPRLTLPFGFVLTDIRCKTPQNDISLSAD